MHAVSHYRFHALGFGSHQRDSSVTSVLFTHCLSSVSLKGSALALLSQHVHWHQREHQNGMRCIVTWGLSPAVIYSLLNSVQSPEMEINPPKSACGCPYGEVLIIINNDHTHNHLTTITRTIISPCGTHNYVNVQLHNYTGWPAQCSAEDRFNDNPERT